MEKMKVGILGTGNIGTDLLIKISRSSYMECVIFVGQNAHSRGMQKARELGVRCSDKSIQAFIDEPDLCDLVFDATSAAFHIEHAKVFSRFNIMAIDMTPAKVGAICVPSINADVVLGADNINMVTCGGQASIPVVHALSGVLPDLNRVEISSLLAADSVGPATLANIDKYYSSTSSAVRDFTGVENVSVALNVDHSDNKPDMLTRIRAFSHHVDIERVEKAVELMAEKVRQYVPGYQIFGSPRYDDGVIEFQIRVRGLGDWIPSYAGNLDIINCAAIAVAERYAGQVLNKNTLAASEPKANFFSRMFN